MEAMAVPKIPSTKEYPIENNISVEKCSLKKPVQNNTSVAGIELNVRASAAVVTDEILLK